MYNFFILVGMNSVVALLNVTLKNEYVYGTGFFINSRHILTCSHVLQKYMNVYIFNNDKLYRVLVKKLDKQIDVAILYSIEYESTSFLEFFPSDEKYENKIEIWGNYKNTGKIYEITATVFNKHYVSYDNFDGIALNVHICRGFSGGPLVYKNKVIGILSWYRNSAKNKDLQLCGGVCSAVIQRFIDKNNVARLLSTRSLTPQDVLKHECYGEFVTQLYSTNIGLSVGDIILEINGKRVGYNYNLSCLYVLYMNDVVNIEVFRKSTRKLENISLDVTKY